MIFSRVTRLSGKSETLTHRKNLRRQRVFSKFVHRKNVLIRRILKVVLGPYSYPRYRCFQVSWYFDQLSLLIDYALFTLSTIAFANLTLLSVSEESNALTLFVAAFIRKKGLKKNNTII